MDGVPADGAAGEGPRDAPSGWSGSCITPDGRPTRSERSCVAARCCCPGGDRPLIRLGVSLTGPLRLRFGAEGWNLRSAPVYDVHITVYASQREEAPGLEEGGAERAGGEMVREGGQKSCEEVEKDRTVGGAGESHHDAEQQHQMLNHPQVRASVRRLRWLPEPGALTATASLVAR